jgi:hypothetical protein|tara:strand:+ start:101 stop:280 length:180 start_codon:yes stop_codon:yes gene_type:complete
LEVRVNDDGKIVLDPETKALIDRYTQKLDRLERRRWVFWGLGIMINTVLMVVLLRYFGV